MRRRSDLRKYQGNLVPLIFDRNKLILALDMGLGKTVIVLTAIRDLLDCLETRKVLVVAPTTVARETWPNEFKEWEHLGIKHSLVMGTPKQREKALAADAEVFIINRENFAWLCEKYHPLFPFDMIVWDESSSLKAGKKKTPNGRLSSFGWLYKVSRQKNVERVILLSGTPTPEGIQGLWAQVLILDGGQRLGKSKTKFFDRWFQNKGWQYPEYHALPGAKEEILRLTSDLMVGLRTSDVLELPERFDNTVYFDLTPEAKAVYRSMKSASVCIVGEGKEISAPSEAAKVNKLSQICSGQIYDEGKEVHFIHNAKLEAFKAIVEQAESENENLLVFYQYQFELDLLKKTFPKAVNLKDDPGSVKRWNEGKIPLLLAHPASAGHGLNLQFGGRVCVWYSLPWSLEQYEQANKRLHRSGQQHTVTIYHLLCRSTIDILHMQSLQEKMAEAGDIVRRICQLSEFPEFQLHEAALEYLDSASLDDDDAGITR